MKLTTLISTLLFAALSTNILGAAQTEFEQTITRNLIRVEDGSPKAVAPAELGSKDYYAIYYSAHWCPPCRRFTPKLVQFYDEQSAKHDNFEIIFVSSDKNEDAMLEYMVGTKMNWPALEYSRKKSSKELTKYCGSGIPCLVLVDNEGKVLADSFVAGKYVGPTKVMESLREKLEQ
ncbi:thioredoxin-like domain-containing protein [Coraliomargarita parva]|uniref:thioredoxin-like domain-containing protein n=1 Tax=Coraliomargarita parva TaxID=3014050 RepID=UPI0022B2C025|nr:thioredoxin-like domain-containing protein [Coraliomargarita parva]